jgi:uncharacterized protein (DUF1778 family)
MSRLSIEIDPEQHRQIKTLATFEGMSIKEFILSRTLPKPKPLKEMDATEKLLSQPKNRERLLAAISEPRNTGRVFESIDELKDALGI